jgi:hypothetical protein
MGLIGGREDSNRAIDAQTGHRVKSANPAAIQAKRDFACEQPHAHNKQLQKKATSAFFQPSAGPAHTAESILIRGQQGAAVPGDQLIEHLFERVWCRCAKPFAT